MTMSLSRWLAVAILLSAGLFGVGAAIERSKHHKESAASPSAGQAGGKTHSEGGSESAAHRAAESGSGSPTAGGETHFESSEKIFGINPESTGLVIAAVATAIVLAVAVWFSAVPLVLLAVMAF